MPGDPKGSSYLSRAISLLSGGGCGCASCGECCVRFSGVLMVCDSDLARWKKERRDDLLARVGHKGNIWYDPASGLREKVCPFLKSSGPGLALCSIHATKPLICERYPGAYQGFRCLKGFRFDPAASLCADRPLIA